MMLFPFLRLYGVDGVNAVGLHERLQVFQAVDDTAADAVELGAALLVPPDFQGVGPDAEEFSGGRGSDHVFHDLFFLSFHSIRMLV